MKKKINIDFPIIGIGASAGGLGAFESFFSSLPLDTEIRVSFVLVQHLAPDHKSILSEIIRRYTDMPVMDVKKGMQVLPNCIYIIPPNYDLSLHGGKFNLTKPSHEHGHRLPIDFFFKSLAEEMQDMAVSVVLSGGGSDGSEGIKDIKHKGGLVIAQKEDHAEYNSMPKNAIDTGFVDYELDTDEMGKKIFDYIKSVILNKDLPINQEELSLHKIFDLLNTNLGHDFSMYKRTTINRRIDNRMTLHKIKNLKDYADFLSENEDEVVALFNEMLIGVTNFFRDPEAFNSLELNAIPGVFDNFESLSTIRVWVAACSTGEEAYSIAILLKEYITKHSSNKNVQIFASDVDAAAIKTARKGIFPKFIAENISPQRLKSFFSQRSDGYYQVNKNIRDMIVFSEHDIIKDPPFSKLDLISCRNLMIYMDVDLQKKLLRHFHYSLNPNGFLFLGTSESIGNLNDIFTTLDQKYKIYQSNFNIKSVNKLYSNRILSMAQPKKKDITLQQQRLSLKEIVEQAILQQISPDAVLVDESGDILYLHGKAGIYLEIPQGDIGVNNIFNMVEDSIKIKLSEGIHKVKEEKILYSCDDISIKINGHYKKINIRVSPILSTSALTSERLNYYLIIFEKIPISSSSASADIASKTDKVFENEQSVDDLRHELQIQERVLQDAYERQEFSNQELKSFNEEMQSLNEELQSTNEELETSREELQSVNEELSTLNVELQSKITDLTRSNNDMNNLVSGTGIGTIFIDHQLNILRFTPEMNKIINLRDGDVGRPLGDIVPNFVEYKNLLKDVQLVLDTLIPKEIEVQIVDGLWFMLRIQPYRTVNNVIEGAVVSFIDITNMVTIRQKLHDVQSMAYLSRIVYDSSDAIVMYDLDGKILAWNPSAHKMYGWSEDDALKMDISSMVPNDFKKSDLEKRKELMLSRNLLPYAAKRLKKDGNILDVMINPMAIIDKDSNVYAISTTEKSINSK